MLVNVGVAEVEVIHCLHLRRQTSLVATTIEGRRPRHHVQVGNVQIEMIGKLVFQENNLIKTNNLVLPVLCSLLGQVNSSTGFPRYSLGVTFLINSKP